MTYEYVEIYPKPIYFLPLYRYIFLPIYRSHIGDISIYFGGYLKNTNLKFWKTFSFILHDNFLLYLPWYFDFQMTWADIYFTAVFDYIQELLKTDLSARIPHLMEVPKHVLMIPKMRRWWDSRPRSHLKYWEPLEMRNFE